MDEEARVEIHYQKMGMADSVRQTLVRTAGHSQSLTLDDLPPVDELHIRGRDATLEMISRAQFAPEDHILDVGCGVGGPSRWLARMCGCRVTGIDITQSFCKLATTLAERTGMQDKVEYCHGSALNMPFEPGSFDGVWMQHVNMNVEDKPGLFKEIRRVLKPGGKLAFYEIIAGSGLPATYPVPWAQRPEISFLANEQRMKDIFWDLDFTLHSWEDVTTEATEWFRNVVEDADNIGPSAEAMRALLQNTNASLLTRNMLANLEEERIRVVWGIATT